jgi:hypothetical protein
MAQHDVFSRRVRWLAIAVGLSAAALTCFLSPLAALVPALLPLAAALQPTLPDTGKRVVKWFTWAWALLWTPYLVGIGFLLLNNFPSHYSMVLSPIDGTCSAHSLVGHRANRRRNKTNTDLAFRSGPRATFG